MVELSLPKNSKIIQGKVFGKKTNESICFNIYRWNRESGSNPRVDKFFIPKKKLGPMALDALLFIKNEIDPTLTFRRSCREGICGSCSMNINGTNTLACLKPLQNESEINIFPLPHMKVIKDLVPDMSEFYEQYKSIKPWLENTKKGNKERKQSPEERKKSLTDFMNVSFVLVAQHHVQVTGGIATNF